MLRYAGIYTRGTFWGLKSFLRDGVFPYPIFVGKERIFFFRNMKLFVPPGHGIDRRAALFNFSKTKKNSFWVTYCSNDLEIVHSSSSEEPQIKKIGAPLP